MHFFKFLNILLMSITWTNTEIEVPVHDNISNYITMPQASLWDENGNELFDEDLYYVYDQVDNSFLSDLNANYIGKQMHTIKVVFPNYYIENKQEIIFNVVDKIKPTIHHLPEFTIVLNQTIPNLTLGLQYSDNYDETQDLTLNVLGKETINNKKVGKYLITYQIIDSSLNMQVGQTYLYVVDITAPEIMKIKETKLELGDIFNVQQFYKITDNHDSFVTVTINDESIDYLQIGKYPFTIIATDSSGNTTTFDDVLEIVYTGKPEIELYLLSKLEVFDSDFEQKLIDNIRSVKDKVDVLTTNDVKIEHTIDINTVGTYDVTYEVTNSNHQSVTKLIKVKVVDETKPEITIINDLVLAVGSSDIIFSNYFLITDNYSSYSDLTIKYVHSIKKDVIGVYNLKVEVTDKDKNVQVLETQLTVADLEAPTFVDFPDHLEIEVFQTLNLNQYTIVDNYDKKPTFTPTTVEFIEIGQQSLLIEAKDQSGNIVIHEIIVTIVDLEAPVLILTTNELKLKLSDKKVDFDLYILDIYDNYDNKDSLKIEIIDNINYHKIGRYEVIYYLTDLSGNEMIKTLIVIIDDINKPIITAKDITINRGFDFNLFDGVEISDEDENVETHVYSSNFDSNQIGTYKILYVAIDSRGNIATLSREIRVVDNHPFLKTPILISLNLVASLSIAFSIYLFLKKKRRL